MNSQIDLSRFLTAQEESYSRALKEIINGKKQTHWMWYIFPQIDGLGLSATSKYFALKSKEEAYHFYKHPILGKRLHEISASLLKIEEKSAQQILGITDAMKLHSSMTLFSLLCDEHDSMFGEVLKKYYSGNLDKKTTALIEEHLKKIKH